ncbi:MAG: hypothetical protein IJ783_10190, partial [Kiritimatiellae bacterium]|nr:hypothetical protein [Kiritimatiellia bacterium]
KTGGTFRVRGVPLQTLRDFAVLRIPGGVMPAVGSLPASLPPGIRFAARLLPCDGGVPGSGPFVSGQIGEATVATGPDGRREYRFDLVAKDFSLLGTGRLAGADSSALAPAFERLDLRWDPLDSLAAARDELAAAANRLRQPESRP